MKAAPRITRTDLNNYLSDHGYYLWCVAQEGQIVHSAYLSSLSLLSGRRYAIDLSFTNIGEQPDWKAMLDYMELCLEREVA